LVGRNRGQLTVLPTGPGSSVKGNGKEKDSPDRASNKHGFPPETELYPKQRRSLLGEKAARGLFFERTPFGPGVALNGLVSITAAQPLREWLDSMELWRPQPIASRKHSKGRLPLLVPIPDACGCLVVGWD